MRRRGVKSRPSGIAGEVWSGLGMVILWCFALPTQGCQSKAAAVPGDDGGSRAPVPADAAADATRSSFGGAAGVGGETATGGGGDDAGGAGGTPVPTNHCPRMPGTPCFEPCGGDPTGVWRLEDSCFSTTASVSSCDIVAEGTPGKSAILLAIQPDGTASIHGTEDWSIHAQMSAECRGLTSADSCDTASYNSDALLFSYTRAMSCRPSACGACDCEDATVHADIDSPTSQGTTGREGNLLRLGFFRTPYCAQGDTLWIGGASVDGAPKVSYKLRKQSCRGTPTPCPARTPDQCMLDNGCYLGNCRGVLAANDARCGAFDPISCGRQPGCRFDPASCAGAADRICDIQICDTQPGCAWGAPIQVCGGNSACSLLAVADCTGPGCSVHPCQSLGGIDPVDCGLIPNAVDCARAPGCVPHPRSATAPCTGRTLCSAQTDATLCETLTCFALPYCNGTAPTDCVDLSVAACATIPGCHPQW